jgi:hypothetical protein
MGNTLNRTSARGETGYGPPGAWRPAPARAGVAASPWLGREGDVSQYDLAQPQLVRRPAHWMPLPEAALAPATAAAAFPELAAHLAAAPAKPWKWRSTGSSNECALRSGRSATGPR